MVGFKYAVVVNLNCQLQVLCYNRASSQDYRLVLCGAPKGRGLIGVPPGAMSSRSVCCLTREFSVSLTGRRAEG